MTTPPTTAAEGAETAEHVFHRMLPMGDIAEPYQTDLLAALAEAQQR